MVPSEDGICTATLLFLIRYKICLWSNFIKFDKVYVKNINIYGPRDIQYES